MRLARERGVAIAFSPVKSHTPPPHSEPVAVESKSPARKTSPIKEEKEEKAEGSTMEEIAALLRAVLAQNSVAGARIGTVGGSEVDYVHAWRIQMEKELGEKKAAAELKARAALEKERMQRQEVVDTFNTLRPGHPSATRIVDETALRLQAQLESQLALQHAVDADRPAFLPSSHPVHPEDPPAPSLLTSLEAAGRSALAHHLAKPLAESTVKAATAQSIADVALAAPTSAPTPAKVPRPSGTPSPTTLSRRQASVADAVAAKMAELRASRAPPTPRSPPTRHPSIPILTTTYSTPSHPPSFTAPVPTPLETTAPSPRYLWPDPPAADSAIMHEDLPSHPDEYIPSTHWRIPRFSHLEASQHTSPAFSPRLAKTPSEVDLATVSFSLPPHHM